METRTDIVKFALIGGIAFFVGGTTFLSAAEIIGTLRRGSDGAGIGQVNVTCNSLEGEPESHTVVSRGDGSFTCTDLVQGRQYRVTPQPEDFLFQPSAYNRVAGSSEATVFDGWPYVRNVMLTASNESVPAMLRVSLLRDGNPVVTDGWVSFHEQLDYGWSRQIGVVDLRSSSSATLDLSEIPLAVGRHSFVAAYHYYGVTPLLIYSNTVTIEVQEEKK